MAIAPASIPRPRPSIAAGLRATRWPRTMYIAQNTAASRAKPTPRTVPSASTPASITTPTTASINAPAERRVRVPKAATVSGPTNSMATALPSGSSSIAR